MTQPDHDNSPIESDLVKEDPEFEDLVTDFVSGLSERLGILERATRDADFNQLKTTAHQLKGAAGGYGYPQLTHVAGQLEQQAISEALEDCHSSLSELKQLISRVVVK